MASRRPRSATRCGSIFRRRRNVRVVLAEVVGFDLAARRVALRDVALGTAPDGARVRHADRLGRLAVLLLRPRRMAGARGRAEVARGRAHHPPPDPRGLRGGRARARPRAPGRAADLRRRRRRADRRRDGRPDRRDRPRRARRLPHLRPQERAHPARRGARPRPHDLPREPLGQGAALAGEPRRHGAAGRVGGRRRRATASPCRAPARRPSASRRGPSSGPRG